MLVTSSKEEAPALTQMLKSMELGELQSQFIPSSEGTHGARALWQPDPADEEYWAALLEFLDKID